ncbi:MAG: hypothetical protein AAGG51_23285 [Cyanobacteria bacterium P01_G01_bin.54]
MSQRDGFASGFFLGAVLGGVVGGVVGVLATARRGSDSNLSGDDPANLQELEPSIESTRRSLETKIAQLNLAIDDVRQQLGVVNGSSRPEV